MYTLLKENLGIGLLDLHNLKLEGMSHLDLVKSIQMYTLLKEKIGIGFWCIPQISQLELVKSMPCIPTSKKSYGQVSVYYRQRNSFLTA